MLLVVVVCAVWRWGSAVGRSAMMFGRHAGAGVEHSRKVLGLCSGSPQFCGGHAGGGEWCDVPYWGMSRPVSCDGRGMQVVGE
jgi:hypothetical protein